jgi:hypothetical protein
MNVPERLVKGLGGQVLGILPVPCAVIHIVVDLFDVPGVELTKCLRVFLGPDYEVGLG